MSATASGRDRARPAASSPARASVPTAPPTKTAANSRAGRKPEHEVQSNAVKLPDRRTARSPEEQNRRPWLPIPVPDSRRNPKTSSTWPRWSPPTTPWCPTPRTSTSRWRSGRRDTAGRASTRRSTRRTSWPPRRPSSSTAPSQGTTGPLFIGRDTHALSEPAWVSALEVLAANDVVAMIDARRPLHPDPAVSHAILTFNRGRDSDLADGIVVTPSHNPPRDGGFKYNPPNGGPADTDATGRDRQARQRDSARRPRRREAGPAGAGAADRRAPRLHERLRRRPAERRRHPRHPRRGDPDRRRPARRRQRRLLGCHRRDGTSST